MNAARIFLLGAVLATAGCGGRTETERPSPPAGGASAAASSEELEGCQIVTKDQVAAALGQAVGDGEVTGLFGCRWKADSGATVVLQAYTGSGLVSGTCDAQKFLVSGRQEAVSGLGDTAVWGSSGDLVVCSSRAVLKVDVDNTRQSPDQDRETAAAVARAALARLER